MKLHFLVLVFIALIGLSQQKLHVKVTEQEVVKCQNLCTNLCTSTECHKQYQKFEDCRGTEESHDGPCSEWMDNLKATKADDELENLKLFETCQKECSKNTGSSEQFDEVLKCQCACTNNEKCDGARLSAYIMVVLALVFMIL